MTHRVRFLLLVICLVGISALLTIPAEAQQSPYLALGDSVPFGFITHAGFEYLNADNFIGFPKYVRQDLRFAATNGACPGETTSSFLSSGGADNGCRFYRSHAHATWRFVQDSIQTSCASSTTSCNVQAFANSPVAGNVWIVLIHTGNNVTISSVTDNQNNSNWVHCPRCHIRGNTNIDMSYNVNGTAGTTSITVNTSGSTGSPTEFDFIELAPPSGLRAAYDTSGGNSSSCPSGTCTGVALTLASKDLVFQAFHGNNPRKWNGWSSPYIEDYNADGVGLNLTSGTAPTITVSRGSATISAIAFKPSATFTPYTAKYKMVGGTFTQSGVGCSSCTINLSRNTTSGDMLYVEEAGANGEHISSVRGAEFSGFTWKVPRATDGTGCRATADTTSHVLSCAYLLKTAASASSITVTMSANVTNYFGVYEISSTTGTFALDHMASSSNLSVPSTNHVRGNSLPTGTTSNSVVFAGHWAGGGTNCISNFALPEVVSPGSANEFYPTNGGIAVLENTFSSTIPTSYYCYQSGGLNVATSAVSFYAQ